MTGRKTLREIRAQLAAARAGKLPTAETGAQETLEVLDRLADELDAIKEVRAEGKPSSQTLSLCDSNN
jgi:acyl-CoA reductase-like NAD-dependent aldehyde dehydrogenase